MFAKSHVTGYWVEVTPILPLAPLNYTTLVTVGKEDRKATIHLRDDGSSMTVNPHHIPLTDVRIDEVHVEVIVNDTRFMVNRGCGAVSITEKFRL